MLKKIPQAVIVAYLLFIYAAVKFQQWYAVQECDATMRNRINEAGYKIE
jgi:hypothetical protein